MHEVLTFWFDTLERADWYRKSATLDALISSRFEHLHRSVVAGETDAWRETGEGRLAEIIVLDQFSRNMFRDKPEAFAADPMALALSQEAVRRGVDQHFNDPQRAFLYMPFMHCESRQVHERAVELFRDLPSNYEFELKHKEIIDRFGRYPHRNAILGRESTDEELDFLRTHKGF